MRRNPIFDLDSYKLSHPFLYPDDLTGLSSHLLARNENQVFFGLQGWIKDKLLEPITAFDIEEAVALAPAHGLPFDKEAWDIVLEDYDGLLPIRIRSLDEGMIVPAGIPSVVVESTDERVAHFVGAIESSMMGAIWYASSVASRAFMIKSAIRKYFEKSCENLYALDSCAIDFGRRAVGDDQVSALGGTAFLTQFKSSDNLPAIRYARAFYGADMPATSIPATEHSVVCAWGRTAEFHHYHQMIHRVHDLSREGRCAPAVSLVIDTWDAYQGLDMVCALAPLALELGVTVVVRLDSGRLDDMLPVTLKKLDDAFGAQINSLGFRVLTGAKVLWSEGVNQHTAYEPYHVALLHGYAAENVLIGIGGGLLQADLSRDRSGHAYKAGCFKRSGSWISENKHPRTASGKRSLRGRQAVVRFEGRLRCVAYENDQDRPKDDLLVDRYLNGAVCNETTLDLITAKLKDQ